MPLGLITDCVLQYQAKGIKGSPSGGVLGSRSGLRDRRLISLAGFGVSGLSYLSKPGPRDPGSHLSGRLLQALFPAVCLAFL